MRNDKSAFRTRLSSVLLGLIMQTACAADPLRIVYFDNYAPISWSDAESMRGVLVDIVDEAIARRLGISVEHRGYPWARAQEMVKKGFADAYLTVVTPERAEYTNTSVESVLSLDNVAYISIRNPRRKDLEGIQTLDDLLPYTLADYYGNGWARKHLAKHNVSWVPGMSNALQMVSAGRVDTFIEASQVIRYQIHKMKLDADIVALPLVLESVKFRLCIRKNSPYADRLDQFDQAIRDMRKDGTLDRIYDKYFIGSREVRNHVFRPPKV